MPTHQPIVVTRAPRPELRPFVHTLWAMESAPGDSHRTERVLPTGGTHIALRVSGDPFRLYDAPGDPIGRDIGRAVVGGARVSPYVRGLGPAASVGALLRPGTAAHLFGTTAGELADRHTPLDALWGAATDGAIERIGAFPTAAERLDAFEAILASRLPAVRGLHPAVAHALGRFASAARVGEVVEETGYSHRHFVALFRDATGLAPKRFCRVLRFRRAVERLAAHPADSHSRVALETGYADQAHFIREFRMLAGTTPLAYQRLAGPRPHHVTGPTRR